MPSIPAQPIPSDPAQALPWDKWEIYAQRMAGGATHPKALTFAGLPRQRVIPSTYSAAIDARIAWLVESQPAVAEEPFDSASMTNDYYLRNLKAVIEGKRPDGKMVVDAINTAMRVQDTKRDKSGFTVQTKKLGLEDFNAIAEEASGITSDSATAAEVFAENRAAISSLFAPPETVVQSTEEELPRA